MKCPHCDIPLMISERKGIEIDFCSQCRGVWLDRGELDKIIDLSIRERAADTRSSRPSHNYSDSSSNSSSISGYIDKFEQLMGKKKKHHSKHYYSQHKDYRYNKRKKKKSLLSEIFDL
ncbi:zf-TFIIB domain-containing protein [Pleionea sediminis]|uniref:TFIIB-type zinc ribbon-containing protein n=1 Tax=Pleionea sediminis TaxID=2569479 RepID=UPI001185733C|nr:zf-TFIIB domain-containing protein [Pleionea sediminis]